MKTITGKTAVVIGGASGVGEGVCWVLGAQGMNIVVADIDESRALAVGDELKNRNVPAIAVKVDSMDSASLESLAAQTVNRFKEISVLVSTVGVTLERPLEEVNDQDWDWIWHLNVVAQAKAVNAFLPYLRKNAEAHVVLTASGGGLVTTPLAMKIGAYCTTKHALVAYTKVLRDELKKEGIGVSLLCPSGVAGRLAETSAKSREAHLGQSNDETGGQQPAGRKLQDADVMGDLVVAAIQANRFYVSNEMNALRDAVKKEHDELAADANFFDNLPIV